MKNRRAVYTFYTPTGRARWVVASSQKQALEGVRKHGYPWDYAHVLFHSVPPHWSNDKLWVYGVDMVVKGDGLLDI